MEQSANYGTREYCRYLHERDEYVAAHAYHYWLLRGCPEGTPEKDWFRAGLEFDQLFLAELDLGIPA